MKEDKPLHVRVAEALGAMTHEVAGVWYDEAEMDAAEARQDPFSAKAIRHYDTDWSATGPLIEKYGIHLAPLSRDWQASRVDHPFSGPGDDFRSWAEGPTPLLAVCNLILALKDEGRLVAA